MNKLLVISFDALSYERLALIKDYPNMSQFLKSAALVGDVSSIFLSNTYPVHTSISTGVSPKHHAIISNTELNLTAKPNWLNRSSLIKRKTIWQAAKEKALSVAAVLWPVTAFDTDIDYNIPEIMAREDQNQVLLSLRAGTLLTTVSAFLKHRKRFKGTSQPALDDFSSHVMADIIKKHHPNLMLLHLTCYDTFCHHVGMASEELTPAIKSLDDNLGLVLSAIDDDTTVIIFSDHAQLPVHKCVNPNEMLETLGFLKMDSEGNVLDYRCFFEYCGGSAFLHNKNGSDSELALVRNSISGFEGFRRFLTDEEMDVCGRAKLPFGIAAEPGFCFELSHRTADYKGNHGYPLDHENYSVFYSISGKRYKKGFETSGGSLLDLTALIAFELGLAMPDIEGKLKKEILYDGGF